MPGATGDADVDGLNDQCEYEVAATFRPTLLMSRYEDPVCRAKEPYWAASKEPYSGADPFNHDLGYATIKIFYAIGYHWDCGSPSAYCAFWCSGHAGDSEFIILEVSHVGSGKWELARAILSAHFNTSTDESLLFDASNLEYSPWDVYKGKPQIWVALNKHGNYGSQSRCDRGAHYTDTCDDSFDDGDAASALSNANLGRDLVRLKDFVPSRFGFSRVESMWAAGWNGFYGWQDPATQYGSPQPGVTQYGELLRFFRF